MSTDITRRKTPEESEQEQKQANLEILEEELTQRELELATIKADLQAFEGLYLRIVGIQYAELDKIKAQIAEAQVRLDPINKDAQKQASQARAQAQESERVTESALEQKKQKKFVPSDELKKLYQEVARSMHPDLTTDEKARIYRHQMMAEANCAYEEGNEDRLREILEQWESSSEAVEGEGTGAELIRVIRKIAQVEARLRAIDAEMAELKASNLWQLKEKVEEAENKERDLLSEMATVIESKIAEAKQSLHNLNIQSGEKV
jgi:hypothetical protein